ncbi:mitochondrial ribonuclease P catalytic subunit-like [Sitodiplosis mosellana]|uniref:mitochondrial ribonuclease P catalytic subunit-like n=1 Tax=Sitodiplosis mosellana TaxID=263140 RepID=UPI0024451CB3|nr:mitochondrial ribonuclease P catalytic subunit-like [Sitodiplosis mosellana]
MFTISTNIKHFVRLRPMQPAIFSYSKFAKLKSNDERAAELQKQRYNVVHTAITSALKKQKCLPASEWKLIVTELQKNPEFRNENTLNKLVFTVLLSLRPNDSLQNARTFIESFGLKYEDLGIRRFIIQLYAKKASVEKLTEAEEQQLIDWCNDLIAREFYILSEMHSIVVMGLCATKEWRKALDLAKPSSSSLNILARKTLHQNEIESTWKILTNLTHLSKSYQHLASKTIVAFAKYFENNREEIPQNAEKLLTFCERLQTVFDEPTLRVLTSALYKSGHEAKITNVDYSGVCRNCNSNLQAVRIANKDFITLQNEFLNNVVGKGQANIIYQKTTPEEWQAFERTIKENGPFDIVMDGLNVSYLANQQNIHVADKLAFTKFKHKQKPCAFALANVVSQLTAEGKRVLVVGRKHMNRWPKMNAIRQMATVFLVDDISKDDIFLLYAALYSGPNSYILSNDYMRQHKFAIGQQFDALFKKWQQEHWYGFTIGTDKPIELVKPMAFKMYSHKIGDFWHLPFKTNAEIESKTWNQYDQPKNWACVRIKQNVEK